MNTGYAAYGNIQKQVETGREADAAVLEKCAGLLRELQKDVTDEAWHDVIRYNQRVWTVIQAEMMEPENYLPVQIKTNLLNLSVYVDKVSFDIMSLNETKRTPEMLDTLININFNIAMGLRGDPGQGVPQSED